MKKIVSYLLILLMCLNLFPIFCFADGPALQYTSSQIETIAENYKYQETMLDALFSSDTAVGYWRMTNNIKSNAKLSFLIDFAAFFLGEFPTEEYYAEILANLITMKSIKLAEQIQNESRFDSLKSAGDYALDVMDIAFSFFGEDGFPEDIDFTTDIISAGANAIVNEIDQLKYYEMSMQDYIQNKALLTAVAENSPNRTLSDAAKSLLNANEELFKIRIDKITDIITNIPGFGAVPFLEAFSFALLNETGIYKNDETIKSFVDCTDSLINTISSLAPAGNFAFKMIILAGDIGFGTTNTYKRYYEMKAMADIAESLVKANESITAPETNDDEIIHAIQEKCYYYDVLIVTHARGEYLLYQLLMEDGGIMSQYRQITEYWKAPEDTTDAWYKGQIDYLVKYNDIIAKMLVCTTADYSVYIPVVEAAYNEMLYDNGWGMLYDIDEDHVDELILMYCSSTNIIEYSVYDIEDNSLITKAEKNHLIYMTGGGHCKCGILTSQGEYCFFEEREQVADDYTDGAFIIYDYASFEPLLSLEWSTPGHTGRGDSFWSINDNACTEAEYSSKLREISYQYINILTPSIDENYGCTVNERTLEQLIEHLEGISFDESTDSSEVFSDSSDINRITESEALALAEKYWNKTADDGLSIICNGLHEFDGKPFYYFILKWYVENHWSAIDYLYVDSTNGDCYFGLDHPEELVVVNEVQAAPVPPSPSSQETTGPQYDTDSEYIFPNSDTACLTRTDIEGLSESQLSLGLNEIYARHGRIFSTEYIKKHFESCSWYRPQVAPDDFDESVLNDVELANINLILVYMQELGYR